MATKFGTGGRRPRVPSRLRRGMPDPVPVVLLARLGIDRSEQGRHLGGHLLVDALRRWVRGGREFGARAVVVDAISGQAAEFYRHSVQDPVRLDQHSEPEPDLALLRPRSDYYADGHPGPSDVLLLVEVCDTTWAFDHGVRLPLYATAGISEVWLVNLAEATIEVSWEPGADGYGRTRVLQAGDSIAPQAFADLLLPVADLIP